MRGVRRNGGAQAGTHALALLVAVRAKEVDELLAASVVEVGLLHDPHAARELARVPDLVTVGVVRVRHDPRRRPDRTELSEG
ncbi:MAG: hypothetical protein AAFP86_12780, partial [Planctomycetota bacterium]